MLSSSTLPRRWTSALLALTALLLLLTPSCKLFTSVANAPGQVAQGLMGGGGKPSERVPPSVLQAGTMRFADTFASRIAQAAQDFAEKAATPEARIQAMTWASRYSTSAFTIASGSNAYVALLDMIVLVTLGRMTHEEYLMPTVWGEADRPMVEAFVSLENEVWEVAGQTLSQTQQDQVRSTLRAWRDENPDMERTAFVRLPAFQDILRARAESTTNVGNALGDLLSVDPLSGLEPAVAEIEKTRLFAERTLYYMQRAPLLLSTEIELLGLKVAHMPEVGSALADSERISLAAVSIADTAAKLPESVRVEREAALNQITSELSRQREGLVADLEKSETPIRQVLGDARTTFEAGTQLSTALQGTIAVFDDLMERFEKKESPSGAPLPAAAEPGKPFDITEYGETAVQLGATLRELNGLVANVDQSLPRLERVMNEAAERGHGAIDHVFLRGIELGAILIALVAIATLLVRWISTRYLGSKVRQAVV